MPKTVRTGASARFVSDRRSARRVSRSAAKTAMASFMSSDGWNCRAPTPTQRDRAPGRDTDAGHEDGHEQADGDHEQWTRAAPATCGSRGGRRG